MKLIFQLFILTCVLSTNAQTIDSPLFNPAAPSTAFTNLNINDLAIAVDKGKKPKVVKVYGKGKGTYLVGPLDATKVEIMNQSGSLKWYLSNSVYTYYDIELFNSKTANYIRVAEAYMLCLSKKYNMKIETLTGSTNWPTYFINDQIEHDDQSKKLEELSKIIEVDFPTLPNNYLTYKNNPFLISLIAKNRVELLDCLSKVENPNITKMTDFYLKEIELAKTAAQNYQGGNNELYDATTYSPMLRAVSKKAREEWFSTQTSWNKNLATVAKFNVALDELKLICEPKMRLLKMDAVYFNNHDLASETLMKAHIKNSTTLKIHKIGLSESDWIYTKNDLGLPLNRYKHGTMWVRNSSDDHTLCKGLFFVIQQEYAGTGYGKSVINEYSEELRGCP